MYKIFEKTVDSLFINKDVDLYITGSNAYLLSSELSTLLTGRYIEIKMLPLSFKEYLSSFEDKTDLIGLRYYMLGQGSGRDIEHILENVVYLELLRRGYEVYIGKYDDLEVDFVARKLENTIYY